MSTIQELLKEIKNLEPIPAVANQLLALVDKPDSSMEDIANVIQYDPVLTASVLAACNSAHYGLKNPAESIKDAINMMGIDAVVSLVVVKSGAKALSGSQEGYGLEGGDLWRYSISSAIIAKLVAKRMGLKNKSTIFTSALLKDIGKIVLESHVSGVSKKIKYLVEEKQFSFREAEKKILGIDHAELGAMIAKMWNFSPKMVNIIKHHHLSDKTMVKEKEVLAVYLADCICMMMGQGVGADGLSYRFKNEAMKELNISADDVSLIIAEFGIGIHEVEELLNMV
jgi:putative nucleotidyltransferase with HDIG domain